MSGSEWLRAWSEKEHRMISVCRSSTAYVHLQKKKRRKLLQDDADVKWQDEWRKGHHHLYSVNDCVRRHFHWSPHLSEEREAEMRLEMSATIFTRVLHQMIDDMAPSSSHKQTSSPSSMKAFRRRARHIRDRILSCNMYRIRI